MWAAFAELQTDMTDLTSDLEGLGMPFVDQRDYATNMLFVALETKPMTSDPVVSLGSDLRWTLKKCYVFLFYLSGNGTKKSNKSASTQRC